MKQEAEKVGAALGTIAALLLLYFCVITLGGFLNGVWQSCKVLVR